MKRLLTLACLIILANVSFGQFIQNGSFNNWQVENLFTFPEVWVVNNEHDNVNILQEKITDAQDGNYAIRLNTIATQNGSDFGYVFYGYPNDGNLTGLPFTFIGDTVRFWYKSNIQSGDRAMAMAVLYAGGETIDSVIVPITTSVSNWTLMSIGINPSHIQPDSLFFGFLSADPFSGTPVAGTWLMVDNVYFTNGNDTTMYRPLPNSSFETWKDVTAENPLNWATTNGDLLLALNDTFNVSKTTDCHSSPYAAKLSVMEINGEQSQAEIIYNNSFGFQPQGFSFYYKYQSVANDTAFVSINFYNGNNQIGHWGGIMGYNQDSTYSLYNVNLSNFLNGTPDWVEIKFYAGNNAGSTLYIDDVTFNYSSTCIPVQNLNTQNITSNSAQLSWQAGNNETLWNLKYGNVGFDPQSQDTSSNIIIANGLTTPGYYINMLNAGSTYDAYVQADCGNGELSSWTRVTFSTNCQAFSAPISENFENTPDNFVPACWNAIARNGAGVQVISIGQATSGMKSLRMQWSNDSSKTFLVSPQISNNLSQLFISFNAKRNNPNIPNITLGTMSNPFDENSFSPLTNFSPNFNYQNYNYYFNNYQGSDSYIALRLTGNNGMYTDIFIDDIIINYLPTCFSVQNLNFQNLTPNSVQINWQAGGNETLWTLKYGIAGFDPNSQDTSSNVTTINGLTTTNYYISNGLIGGVMYDVYVQADCGSGDLSVWNKISFVPPCQSFSVPVSENFESTPHGAIPNCWKAIKANGSDVSVVTYWQSTSGSNSLRMQWGNNMCKAFFVSPQIANPLNQLSLSFNAKAQSMNQPILTIGTMSNPFNDSTFMPLTSYQISNNYESFTYLLNNYSGSNQYLAFKLTANQEDYTEMFIDDVIIEYIPSCPKPTALNVSNITSNSAQLSWTAGGNETKWQIEIGYPGFTPGTNNYWYNGTADTIPMWNAQGLTQNNANQYFVRAICDSMDISSWAGPFNFTTLCANYPIPFYEDFSSSYYGLSSCWNRNVNNWFGNPSNYAGASYPELYYSGNYGYSQGKQSVTTPYIDALTSNSLMVSFKHAFTKNSYIPFTIGVEVTTDDVNWNTVWSQSPTTNITPDEITIDLSAYAHQIIKLSWFVIADTTNDNSWSIDNILVDVIPTCPKPKALNVSNITSSSAQLSWTAGSNETQWQIEISYQGFTPGTYNYWFNGTADTVPMWNAQGLTPNTSYQYYVRAICDSMDVSSWAGPFSFMTPCANYPIPFYEDFSSCWYSLPPCWNRSVNNWVGYPSNNAGSNSPELIFSENYGYAPGKQRVTTPFIDASSSNTLMVSFKHAFTQNSLIPYTIGLEISTDDINWTTVWSLSPTSNFGSEEKMVDLSAYAHQLIKLSWFVNADTSNNNLWSIDNIFVDVIPTCPKPTALNASNITSTSAQLSWTAGSNETQWQIEISYPGFTPGTLNYWFNGIADSVPVWNAQGLTSNTSYQYFVGAICDSMDVSSWAGPFNFTTPCASYTVPFYEEFNSNWWDLPLCWSRTINSWYNYTSNAAGGNYGELTFNGNYNYSTGKQRATSPYIDASASNSLMLSFRQALILNPDSSFQNPTIGVEVTTDDINWTTVWSLSPTSNINPEEIVINLSAYAHQTIKISWFFDGQSQLVNQWAIDNVIVDIIPTCPKPTALNANNVLSSSADLSWTAGGTETKWNIKVGNQGFSPNDTTYIQGATGLINNFWTVQGLNSLTTYDFYVKADCDSGDFSVWAGPFTFTTTCGFAQVPYYQDFESSYSIPVCNSIENAGEGNYWNILYNPGNGFNNNTLSYSPTMFPANAWYFTQGVELTGGTNYSLRFRYGNNTTAWTEKLRVFYGKMPNSSAMNMQLLDFPSINLGLSQNALQYFTPDSSGIYHFGFNAYSDANQYYLFVDDIAVEVAPSCQAPTNLTANMISANNAFLSWSGCGLADAYQIEWGEASFNLGAGTTDFTSNTNYMLAGVLAPATQYKYYVRSLCQGDSTAWTGPYYFTTECEVVTEFYENFDALNNFALPTCFKKVTTTGNTYTYTSNAYSYPNNLDMYSAGPSDILVVSMPHVSNAGSNTHWLRFMAKGTANGTLEVGYLTNPIDANSFVVIKTIHFNDDQYHQYSIKPDPISGGNTTFAFRHAGTPSFTASIDNVSWEAMPSCPGPDMFSVQVSNLTSSSFNINWTDLGSASQWEVNYGIAGQGFTHSIITNTNSATLSNLVAFASYQFQIKSLCSNDSSQWVGTFYNYINGGYTCFPGAVYGQVPVPMEYSLWASQDYGRKPHQNFTGINAPFNGLHFWGRMHNTQNQCYSNPIEIEVGFYSDNNGSIGTQLTSFIIPVVPHLINTDTANQVYDFTLQFPQTITQTEGWFSLQSVNSPTCYLLVFNTTNPAAYGKTLRVQNQGMDTVQFNPIGFCFLYDGCPAPNNLTATNINASSADLNWNQTGASKYNVEVGLNGFMPGQGVSLFSTTDITSNTWHVNGLTPGTQYSFYVQSDCDTSGSSTWVGPFNFTTSYTHDLYVSQITSPSAEFCYDGSSNVVITIVNAGIETITGGFPVSYKINSDTAVTETVNDSIGAGGSITYTFATPIQMILTGSDFNFDLNIHVNALSDQNHSNDTFSMPITFKFTPDIPVTVNDIVPYGAQANLSASSNAPIYWYEDLYSTNSIHTGNTFTTPPVFADLTYYVNAQNGSQGVSGYVGLATSASNVYFDQTYPVNKVFNVLNPSGVLIESVDIMFLDSGNVGTPFEIFIKDSAGSIIQTYNGQVTASNVYLSIPVNFTVPQGNSYKMGFTQPLKVVVDYNNGNNFPYPFELPGTISILYDEYQGNTFYQYYTYFFNWKVSTLGSSCSSNRAEVKAIVQTPICYFVNNVTVNNITVNSADLLWTPGGSETSWDIELGYAGFNPTGNPTYTNVSSSPYTVNGLSAITTYEFYIRSNCDSTQSIWKGPFSFTTLFNCTPITAFPWTEGFEGSIFPPFCWQNLDVNTDGFQWFQSNSATMLPHSGNNLASSASWQDGIGPLQPDNWLITPQISINNPDLEFSMWYAGRDPSFVSEKFSVLISTTGTNPTDFVEVFTTVVTSSTYNELILPLSAYSGQNIYIAIRHWGCTDMYNLLIDDISVRSSLCKDPTNLSASNITSNSAQLDWNQIGIPFYWKAELGLPGFNPGTGSSIYSVNTGSKPWSVNNLTPSTNYQFYVQAVCDTNGTVSLWVGPFGFSTLEGCPAPIVLTASNILSTQANLSWSPVGTATSWVVEVGEPSFSPGSNLYTYTNTLGTNSWTVQGLTEGHNYCFYVRANCDSNIVSAWAGPYYFMTPYMCPAPTALNANSIQTTMAILYWTPGGTESLWNVEVGYQGFQPGTSAYLIADTLANYQFACQGLTANTVYVYYVKALCGPGGVSTWAGPFTFQTECEIYNTPFTETFEPATFPPNCWKSIQGSGIWKKTTNAGGFGNSNASALFDFYNVNGTIPNDLITFNFNATSLSNPVLKFDYAYAYYDSMYFDHLDILSSTDGGITYSLLLAMPGKTLLNTAGQMTTEFVPTANQWATQSIPLPAGTNKIKFRAISGYGNDLYIDNVTVDNMIGCPNPTALTAMNITGNSADLGWNQAGSPTQWKVEVGYPGFAPGTGSSNLVSNTITSNKPWTVIGLAPGTNYVFYVQAICDSNSVSAWAGPFGFSTLISCPAPISLYANNIQATKADLSWMHGASETFWNIEVGTPGFVPGINPLFNGTAVTNPIWTVQGLSPNTPYHFYVRAVCDSNHLSTWAGPFYFITTGSCPQAVCPSNTLTVCSNTSPFVLTGATPSGGVYSGQAVVNNTFYPANASIGANIINYTFTDSSCFSQCNFTINVLATPTVTIPPVNPICSNDTVVLAAHVPQGTYIFNWNTGATTQNIFVSHSDTYTVSVTDFNGCIGTASQTVIVNPTPNAATIQGSTTVCINATYPNITFTNPQTYPVIVTYNINGNNQSTINIGASTTAQLPVATTVAGSFTYNIVSVANQSMPVCVNNSVTGTATVTVTPAVGIPTTILPSSTTICQGSGVTTYTTSASNATSYNWSITGTGNSISGTGTTGTVTWAAGFTGTATISVTANGCNGPSAAATTTVVVRPTPEASINGTISVYQNSASPNITFTNPQPLAVTITYNINGGSATTVNVNANSTAQVSVPTNVIGVFNYNMLSVSYQDTLNCTNQISGTATVTVLVPVQVFSLAPITGATLCLGGSTTIAPPALPTGGSITTAGGYRIHKFTSSGSFVSAAANKYEVLVVAGGGGSGPAAMYGAGGGGAGGYINTLYDITSPLTVGVTVGNGGAFSTVGGVNGSNGGNSVFGTLTANGGGGGGARGMDGSSGGSGGGGGSNNYVTIRNGGIGITGQGYNGGSTINLTSTSGAGGGGASGIGGNCQPSFVGGAGGLGVSNSISGSLVLYASGGKGGTLGVTGTASAVNTGKGGDAPYGGTGVAFAGGSGVVIVRYPDVTTGKWTSSNPGVATIDSITGAVTSISSGTTQITYTCTYNGISTSVSAPVTVSEINTVILTSATGTNNQTLGVNTILTNITYSTTGATDASITGLPDGTTGSWSANAVTISGTPTVSGTFNYTVTLTGGCGNVMTSGTIAVDPDKTAGLNGRVDRISEVTIFPNPFNDKTTVEFSNYNNSTYIMNIYDFTGKLVRTINNISGNKVEIVRGSLNTGYYMLELKGEKIFRGRIIVN